MNFFYGRCLKIFYHLVSFILFEMFYFNVNSFVHKIHSEISVDTHKIKRILLNSFNGCVMNIFIWFYSRMLRELIPSDLVKAYSPDDWKRVSIFVHHDPSTYHSFTNRDELSFIESDDNCNNIYRGTFIYLCWFFTI